MGRGSGSRRCQQQQTYSLKSARVGVATVTAPVVLIGSEGGASGTVLREDMGSQSGNPVPQLAALLVEMLSQSRSAPKDMEINLCSMMGPDQDSAVDPVGGRYPRFPVCSFGQCRGTFGGTW